MTLGVAIFTIVARRHRDRSMVAAAAAVGLGRHPDRAALHLAVVAATCRRSSSPSSRSSASRASGSGSILYTIGARHLHAARSALISALDTPLAPLWVWLAFGLRPAVASVIGGGIVLAAVITNILSERSPVPVLSADSVVESV